MRKLKKTKVKLLVTLLSFVLLFCGTMGSSLAWLLDKTGAVTNTFTPSTIGVMLTESTVNYKMIPGWTISKDPKVTVVANSEDCYVFVKVDEAGSATVDNKSYTFEDFISYNINTSESPVTTDTSKVIDGNTVTVAITHGGWKQLTDNENNVVPDVYYRVVDYSEKVQEFYVLGSGSDLFDLNTTPTDAENDDTLFSWSNNQVLTNPTVTKEMMNGISSNPTLTFTAYACQRWKQNEPATGADEDAVNAAQFTPYEAWRLASANAN